MANLKVTNTRWYPKYHIAAPAGWVNDPNGFCYFKGKYHFFYQHHPFSPEWGPMHWGHVASYDLVHWQQLPIALAPDRDKEFDNDGVFSGSGIEYKHKMYLMYTGNISLPEDRHAQKQCLAVSEDGINFTKSKNNPIIDELPPDVDMVEGDFRDPKVWEHDGKFYCVLGAKTSDEHGQVVIYESTDLQNWTFKNVSTKAEENRGTMWECPNFAEVDGQDVLIISPMGIRPEDKKFLNNVDVTYSLGKLDYGTGIFTRGDFDMIDYGFDFYAPQVTKIPDGRTILIGWMDMWFMPQPEKMDGWAGQMTVPRELKIVGGKLFTPPIPELKTLRENCTTHTNLSLEQVTRLEDVGGAVGELCLKTKTKKFSIEIRSAAKISVDGSILKLIRYPLEDDGLGGEREVKISASELNLQIFLDKSSVEVFVNGGERVLSARIYPAEADTEIAFIPEGRAFKIDEVNFYTLAQAVPNPRI